MSKKSFIGDIDNPAELFISNSTAPEKEETASTEGSRTETTRARRSTSAKAPAGYKINPLYVETRSQRVQLLLQPTLAEALKKRAKKQKRSFNDLVHEILEEAMKEE